MLTGGLWWVQLGVDATGSGVFGAATPKTPAKSKGHGHRRSISQAPDPLPKTDPWRKETGWNLSGCLVYLMFLAAYVFYYYVRVRYTLAGGYLWYSIAVLVFELMASSSMIVHGLCLLRVRLPRKSTDPVPAQPYVVRVLIPCYTESLEIVAQTVLAAANADLPHLACRTVYLLDDGKDAAKAAWVAEQGREDIVYISGRVRSKGETNGKACNLNNTLCQLYPKDVPVDDMEVSLPLPPPNQTCHACLTASAQHMSSKPTRSMVGIDTWMLAAFWPCSGYPCWHAIIHSHDM